MGPQRNSAVSHNDGHARIDEAGPALQEPRLGNQAALSFRQSNDGYGVINKSGGSFTKWGVFLDRVSCATHAAHWERGHGEADNPDSTCHSPGH